MIKLTLKNNLRNLLGPHHLQEGESFAANPGSFYKEKCIWNMNGADWNEGLNLDLRLKSPFISKAKESLLKKYMVVDNEILQQGA